MKTFNEKNIVAFILDGVIGVGKSTIIQALAQRNPKFKVYLEPLDRFENCCGENLLQKFYDSKTESAFTLQCHVSQCMVDVMKSSEKSKSTKIVERGVSSGQKCFASTLFHMGKLSTVEYHLLANYFDSVPNELKKHTTIYLKADLETLLKRIKNRNRMCENKITKEYLEILLFEYERFYLGIFKSFEGKVFVIDATQDQSKIVLEIEKIIRDYETL